MSSSTKATKQEVFQLAILLRNAGRDNDQQLANTTYQQISVLKCKARVRSLFIVNGAQPPAIPFNL